ncbi:sensor histidine kinase [Streptosporangium sp. CA-135522]|uniref:sensor histidine kinase n=1 Tax=Streptosporangium sp. CA-135522 TaxID=3240072 RepID=UPI003D917AF2
MEYGEAAPIGDRTLKRVNRLSDRVGPWALGLAVFLFSWVSGDGLVRASSLWHRPGFLPLLVMSALAAGFVRRARWPLFVLAAVGWVSFGLWPAVFVASYHAGTSLRRRIDVVAYALAAAVIMGGSAAADAVAGTVVDGERHAVAETAVDGVMALAVLVALPLVAGLWVNARRQVIVALRERAERLERDQRDRADRVRAQERTRIAREMHDIVAHRVSLMVLHAGALEVGTAEERSAQTAALIQGIGREALVNLREVLGVLRSPYTDGASDGATGVVAAGLDGDGVLLAPQPMLADLDRLLDQSRSLGISVSRHDEGAVRPLPAMVERTAYRLVQEALTNVHKHAGDAAAEVFLRYLPETFEVTVDNGVSHAVAEPLPGAGLGLTGLRERVELVGGEFRVGRLPGGGFRTSARLPAEQTEGSA